MAKRGPVPRYKPDFCAIAYKFGLLGATNDDLAGLFEVSHATVGNWLARYPDFKQAVHEGRDVADADVAQSLLHKAKGITHPDVKVLAIAGEAQEVTYNRYFPPDTRRGALRQQARRGGEASPDDGDALALTFAYPVARKDWAEERRFEEGLQRLKRWVR